MNLFIQNLFSPEPAARFLYLAVVLSVVISIVLHELAHGWAAIRLGDDTPIRSGRMTGNPLVHMGPWSLVMLALIGIAWGQMPIDPGRLRGRYAEAKVALAGPGMNLVLAVIALTALGLWFRMDPAVAMATGNTVAKAADFLHIFGMINLLLMAFNLLPVPPLDGSHVAANFSPGYARALSDPSKHGMWMLGFIFAFIFAQGLFAPIADAAIRYVELVAGL